MREGARGAILCRPRIRPESGQRGGFLRPTRATRGGGASAAGPTPEGATHTLGAAEAVGSPWTGMLVATTLLAFAGIFTSPVYLNWAVLSPQPDRLARHLIWSMAILLGTLLVCAGPAATTADGGAGNAR